MSLTINNQTDLSQIARFIAEKGKDETLLAKKDGDGNTVLYTRSERALEGKRGQFTAFKEKMLSKLGHGKAAFARKEVAKFIKTFNHQRSNELLSKTNSIRMGQGAVVKFHEAMNMAEKAIGSQKHLTGQVANFLSSVELLSNTLSRIVDQKLELTDVLRPLPPTDNVALEGGKVWKNATYDAVTAPNMQIAGKTYEATELLGTGGNGTVFRYVAKDGSQLAVKIPPDKFAGIDAPRMNEMAARELNNTTRLMEGNANIIGVTQHIPLQNGLTALAGEIMPNGDLMKLGEVMNNRFFKFGDVAPVPNGQIGSLERNLVGLTMLLDSAKGLAGMHANNKVSHGDVKSQNVMLDSNGIAKLIDLGESAKSDGLKPANYTFPDNPRYRAPEITEMLNIDDARFKDVRAANKEMFGVLMNSMASSLRPNEDKGVTQRDLVREKALRDIGESMAKSLEEFVRIANNSDLKTADSFDSFGLGTLGFELLVGGLATENVPGSFQSQIESNIEAWRETGKDFIGLQGLAIQGSGDTQIDRLLNGMLSSDPNTRLTAAQVRDHPLMNTPGVGSPAVRELIVALSKDDPKAIDIAREKIREEFGKK